MLDPVTLSVILPAYAEGRSLATIIPKLGQVLTQISDRCEIVVIDTKARLDDTGDVCALNAVRHVRRRGGERYGDAVRTGIAEARGTHILFMDADGSHDPEAIVPMWSRRAEADIVIGSRYVSGAITENRPLLVALSQLLGLVFRTAFHLPLRDVTTSFRLYEGTVLRRLHLEGADFDILQEILIKALMAPEPARVTEVPVIFHRRIAGESKRRLLSFLAAYVKTFMKLKTSRRNAARNLRAG